jgi:DNA-binding MarR family transcriptional regulator
VTLYDGQVSTPGPLDELEMAAWHSMLRAHASVVRRLEAELLAEQGLSLPAYEVLSHLSDMPDRSLRMTELSAAALLSPSGVTRLVDKLQREGLVRRRRCAADARVIYCELTEAGFDRLVAAYPTHLRGVRQHMIDKLDRDDLIGVASSMGKLADATACSEAAEAAEVDAELEQECEAS